jgi:hypothetical protein
VALGYWPDAQAGTVAETSELEPASREAFASREVVQLLTRCLVGVVRALRQFWMVRVEGVL